MGTPEKPPDSGIIFSHTELFSPLLSSGFGGGEQSFTEDERFKGYRQRFEFLGFL
jgi:hypothetical protein